MTVLITLTVAGADSGPFNLFSNLDGYVSAFATGVSKASLLAGYSSSAVPDGTTIVRVISVGNCTNYIDIVLSSLTTTTTTNVPTTTTTTTGVPATCYSYSLYGVNPGIAYWNNCDGTPDSQYINGSETFVVPCAIEDSILWSGGITQLSLCTSPSTTTTTTTAFSGTCYGYSLYGINPGIATWTNCNGTTGSQYLNTGETYVVTCAQAGSVVWSGGVTQLSICNPTTTTTTTVP